MTSFTNPPERIRLRKRVEETFKQAGWQVTLRDHDEHDYAMSAEYLEILVQCFDETRIRYENPTSIIGRMGRHAEQLHNAFNLPYLAVLDRNFLSADLSALLSRGILVVVQDNLDSICELSSIRRRLDADLTPSQNFIVTHSLSSSIALSNHFRAQGDMTQALGWARSAVKHGVGFHAGLGHLFSMLLEHGELDEAEQVCEVMQQYRPTDTGVLSSLAELAESRGNHQQAEAWRSRITRGDTTVSSFDDILAKQRIQPGSATDIEPNSATSWAIEPQPSLIGRVFRRLRAKNGN